EPLSPLPRPRGEADPRPIARQTRSHHSSVTPSRSRFDDMLKEALVNSNRHPLELQLAREGRSPRVLPAIAGGTAAAIGVIVVTALVFFNVVPKLNRDPSLAVSISSPASATAAPTTPRDTQAL